MRGDRIPQISLGRGGDLASGIPKDIGPSHRNLLYGTTRVTYGTVRVRTENWLCWRTNTDKQAQFVARGANEPTRRCSSFFVNSYKALDWLYVLMSRKFEVLWISSFGIVKLADVACAVQGAMASICRVPIIILLSHHVQWTSNCIISVICSRIAYRHCTKLLELGTNAEDHQEDNAPRVVSRTNWETNRERAHLNLDLNSVRLLLSSSTFNRVNILDNLGPLATIFVFLNKWKKNPPRIFQCACILLYFFIPPLSSTKSYRKKCKNKCHKLSQAYCIIVDHGSSFHRRLAFTDDNDHP